MHRNDRKVHITLQNFKIKAIFDEKINHETKIEDRDLSKRSSGRRGVFVWCIFCKPNSNILEKVTF